MLSLLGSVSGFTPPLCVLVFVFCRPRLRMPHVSPRRSWCVPLCFAVVCPGLCVLLTRVDLPLLLLGRCLSAAVQASFVAYVVKECRRVGDASGKPVLPHEIHGLTGAVRTFLRVDAVAKEYCIALCNVCKDLVDNRLVCGEHATQLVLDILAAFPDSDDIQSNAMAALVNMTAGCDPNRQALVRLGGLERVMATADRHLDSAPVSQFVCGITSNIANLPEARASVLKAGCLSRVSAATDRHATNALVQYFSCAALWNLGCSVEGKAAIIKSGCVKRVNRAKATHPDDLNVQEQADGALGVLL